MSGHLNYLLVLLVFLGGKKLDAIMPDNAENDNSYATYVKECLDILLEYGTDRYGKVHTPILVSILDVENRNCPSNPVAFDEYFRVTRRERRNPAGSNMLTDQAMLKTMYFFSAMSGTKKYENFADNYAKYVQKSLVDNNGFYCRTICAFNKR